MEFSFCESVYAGGNSPWHIRKLTEKGKKLGGGIDSSSLCGHVTQKVGGWDLDVEMTKHHLDHNACKKCVQEYRAQVP